LEILVSNPGSITITSIPAKVMAQLIAYQNTLNATLAAELADSPSLYRPLTLEDTAYHLMAEGLQRWVLAQASTSDQAEIAE